MYIDRRNFIKWSGAAFAATNLSSCSLGNKSARFYGGYRDHGNKYGAACIDQSGELLWKLETPARVHEVCLSPDLSMGAVMARRPGDFIQLFNPLNGEALDQLKAPEGLIFEGHALFRNNSSSQVELWVTASPVATSESVLLKYKLMELGTKPEQISIAGLGPHQMLLDEMGNIIIAVGGWKSEGRTVLNADSFESGLVFFNPEAVDSIVSSQHFVAVPNNRLSARHMDSTGSDLWVGMQLADPAPTEDILLYRYSHSKGWQAATEPEKGWQIFNGYIGSVAVTSDEVVATSPQGHLFGRWNLDGLPLQTTESLDIAAATELGDNWWLSSGLGEVWTGDKKINSNIFWDNHWVGHLI